MVVQKWKSFVLLDHVLFRNYCLAVRAASCTSPPALVCMATTLLQRGVESETLTTELRDAGGSDRLGTRRRKYIVNPSRYSPSYLQRWTAIPDHRPLSLKQQCLPLSPVPPTPTISLQTICLAPPTDPSPFHKRVSCNLAMLILEPRAIRLGLPPPLLPAGSISTFSSTSSPSTPPHLPRDNKPTPAQLSFVLLKLREELPVFFDGHHSLDMYSVDMTFENSLGPRSWTVRGHTAYSVVLGTWRLALKMCYSQCQVDLLKISKDVEMGTIEARWRVRGRLRAPWTARERVVVEAFSTFTINSDGSVSTHKVDKVMPGGKERSRVMSWLAQVGVALRSGPQPSVQARTHDILLQIT